MSDLKVQGLSAWPKLGPIPGPARLAWSRARAPGPLAALCFDRRPGDSAALPAEAPLRLKASSLSCPSPTPRRSAGERLSPGRPANPGRLA